MLGFKKYFLSAIVNNYADFTGLASRKQYWLYILWRTIIFTIIVWGAVLSSFIYNISEDYDFSMVWGIVFLVCLFGILIPSIAITVRRLRDANLSGYLYFIVLVPYIGAVVIFIMTLLPSVKSDNRFITVNKSESELEKLKKEVEELKKKMKKN